MEAEVPEQSFEGQLAGLGLESWRSRRSAISFLVQTVKLSQGDEQQEYIQRLIESAFDPQSAIRSSASCDLLSELGEVVVGEIRAKVRLNLPDPRKRRILIELIGRIACEEDVELLASVLERSGEEQNVRTAAISALGNIGGAAAERALLACLSDDSEIVVLFALDALRNCGAQLPLARLEELLGRSSLRGSAVSLLGQSKEKQALPLIIEVLDDPQKKVRNAGFSALASFFRELDPLVRVGEEVQRALESLSPAARSSLHAQLSSDEGSQVHDALFLIAVMKDASALEKVADLVDNPSYCEAALSYVAELGEGAGAELERIFEKQKILSSQLIQLCSVVDSKYLADGLSGALVRALDDGGENTIAAAEVLAQNGGPEVLPHLFPLFEREGELGRVVASSCAQILLRLSEKDRTLAERVLRENLNSEWSEKETLACNLCSLIGRLAWPQFSEQLIPLMQGGTLSVRVAATQALGSLLKKGRESDRTRDVEFDALCFALVDEDSRVRSAACSGLGHRGNLRGFKPLISATSDSVSSVRMAAVRALIRLDSPVVLARLRELVVDDPFPGVLVAALEGLGRWHHDEDLSLFMSLCSSDDNEITKAAARALSHYRAHRATAALLGLLDHNRWDVRWTAVETLSIRDDRTALDALQRYRLLEEDASVKEMLEATIDKMLSVDRKGGKG